MCVEKNYQGADTFVTGLNQDRQDEITAGDLDLCMTLRSFSLAGDRWMRHQHGSPTCMYNYNNQRTMQ